MTASRDVVVVGGGVMGCAIALRLAQARLRVVVLERSIPGAEASSAAAGILAAQEEATAPGPMFDLMLRSRELFPALADELLELTGVSIGYRRAGVLSVASGEAGEELLERRYAWQRAAGLRLTWLRGDDVRAAEPAVGANHTSALHFPEDGQLETRAYARALSLAAAAAGAEFVSGAHVRRIVHDGERVSGVEVEGETIAAGAAVIAAGSWSSLVAGTEAGGLPARAVRPMRGQIVELETRPPAVRGTIVGEGGYVVGRSDGRVLCGSTMELAGYDRRVTAAGVRHCLDVAVRLAPGLAEAPVTDMWANFRPATADALPFLGTTPLAGLFLATGHFRNGILLSPVTGEILGELLTRGSSPVDLSPFRVTRLHRG